MPPATTGGEQERRCIRVHGRLCRQRCGLCRKMVANLNGVPDTDWALCSPHWQPGSRIRYNSCGRSQTHPLVQQRGNREMHDNTAQFGHPRMSTMQTSMQKEGPNVQKFAMFKMFDNQAIAIFQNPLALSLTSILAFSFFCHFLVPLYQLQCPSTCCSTISENHRSAAAMMPFSIEQRIV